MSTSILTKEDSEFEFFLIFNVSYFNIGYDASINIKYK